MEVLQAVHAVQKANASVKAHYMAALGEWLVQQGTAREAGKEILLGAAALLEPPMPATVQGSDTVYMKKHRSARPVQKVCLYLTRHSVQACADARYCRFTCKRASATAGHSSYDEQQSSVRLFSSLHSNLAHALLETLCR